MPDGSSSQQLRDLVGLLRPDPWRQKTGFSSDIDHALEGLHAANNDEERADILGKWLARFQPCIFGRIAARRGLLFYCFLTPNDIASGDDAVRHKINDARRRWLAAAIEGQQSGFVISVLLPELDGAEPDETVAAFASKFVELYLLEEHVQLDRIYQDTIRFETPLRERATWEWDVGVNYFSAQGDRRWWHDHRIPAGMALSMNSVGHMVKSSTVTQAANALRTELRLEPDADFADVKLDTLAMAHAMAMRTIDNAAVTSSGPATHLVPHPGAGVIGSCPHVLPQSVAEKDFTRYLGYYHTDVTLPSVYFRPDVDRPSEAAEMSLDFTYLVESVADPIDSLRMGSGRRVREPREGYHDSGSSFSKFGKARHRVRQ